MIPISFPKAFLFVFLGYFGGIFELQVIDVECELFLVVGSSFASQLNRLQRPTTKEDCALQFGNVLYFRTWGICILPFFLNMYFCSP